ncbi:HpcH/HpaI aldolase/citrate lyase family protein [Magnetococcus sp. PR-3]|uniref:HpcH/HpaI aldolase/citrate lyase family protein n=1 Tax=Magnetococcus sp. PR-3 TaxID=3120355 RepID=UPI002FCDFF13
MKHAAPVLLRSTLYVPGSNPRALAKSADLGADALIFDLEDSVAPEMKGEARRFIREALAEERASSPLTVVRINAMATSMWREDLEATLGGQPDAIAVPKVNHRDELQILVDFLMEWEQKNEIKRPMSIWPMVESPLGVINALTIAQSPRVNCLIMGTSDLAKALHVRTGPDGRDGMSYALQHCVLAARAAGVAILDGVYVDIQGEEGFVAQCQEGVRLGFDGKTLVHPSQVQPANRAFLPDQVEIQRARRVLEGWRKASAKGEEICVVDGYLVERLHAEDAQRLITLWDQAQDHLRRNGE